MKIDIILQSDDVILRSLTSNDLDEYYKAGFLNCDQEVNLLTGTTQSFTKEQISDYLIKIEKDKTRYDFLIISEDKIKGEIVLNEIKDNVAGFRIYLFNIKECNKGIGSKAMRLLFDFAFNTLGIKEIELEVLVNNPRAKHVYKKFGFKEKEILKNEYHLESGDVDAVVMSLKKDDYIF